MRAIGLTLQSLGCAGPRGARGKHPSVRALSDPLEATRNRET